MKTTLYKNPLTPLYLAFGCFGLAFLGIPLVSLIVDLMSGNKSLSSHAVNLVSIVLFGLLVPLAFIWTPDIELHEDGLRVQAFVFHWMWVPWSDIIGLTEPVDVKPSLRGVLVRTKGLTVFHRLITLFHGAGTTPGFIISDSLNGYETLVEIVREKWEEQMS